MKSNVPSQAATRVRSIIGEPGFTAILRNDAIESQTAGVIGNPRSSPTSSGLWIEDDTGATIDAIVIAILQDFAVRRTFAFTAGDESPDVAAWPERLDTATCAVAAG